jgi:hypothetical protein
MQGTSYSGVLVWGSLRAMQTLPWTTPCSESICSHVPGHYTIEHNLKILSELAWYFYSCVFVHSLFLYYLATSFWWIWGLNLGLCTYKAGAPPLDHASSPPAFWGAFILFPRLV